MTTLYYEQRGAGPELVLVHGWGMHGSIWGAASARLAEAFRVTTVDLPGHGRSPFNAGEMTLTALADAVGQLVPGPAVWLGWSLGALVTLARALDAPDQVRGLVLVAATPRFVRGDDWDCAMAPETLQGFADGLLDDYRVTLTRFLSLQTGTGDNARSLIKVLRTQAFAHGEPDSAALAAALALLGDTDLRRQLSSVTSPTLLVRGGRDRLAPLAAAEFALQALPQARALFIDQAGHAPFLSHPQAFVAAVKDFVDGL